MQVLSNLYIFDHTLIFILYNGVAFLMQPLAGILIDKFHKEKLMLIVSIIFIILGAILNHLILSCVFLGLANQLFHVAGGKICTNFSTNKAWHLGLFVSLGAIGLMLGSNFSNDTFLFIIPIILYSLLIIIVCLLYKEEKNKEIKPITNEIKISKKIFAVIFLIVVVFIRSFVGKIIHYGFEMNITFIVLLGIASAFGKFIGGILKDLFGSLKVIFLSLVLCGIILLFLDNISVLMLIGTILINISMPITLFELNKINPNHEGLNFGLLAASLFPGVAIGLIYQYEVISYTILVILSVVHSIYGIYYTTRLEKCGR
jgi:FSR family fosmidomycin resistance protein-like MFS transporter